MNAGSSCSGPLHPTQRLVRHITLKRTRHLPLKATFDHYEQHAPASCADRWIRRKPDFCVSFPYASRASHGESGDPRLRPL